MSTQTPIFLESYDWLKELNAWRNGEGGNVGGHWMVGSFSMKSYKCELSWRFGEAQIGHIAKAAPSLQEAVWLALKEFEDHRKEVLGK